FTESTASYDALPSVSNYHALNFIGRIKNNIAICDFDAFYLPNAAPYLIATTVSSYWSDPSNKTLIYKYNTFTTNHEMSFIDGLELLNLVNYDPKAKAAIVLSPGYNRDALTPAD